MGSYNILHIIFIIIFWIIYFFINNINVII